MYEGMWIPLHRDLAEMVKLLSLVAQAFRETLRLAEHSWYLDREHKLAGEHDMFGRIVWPMAHDTVLWLVPALCAEHGVACALPEEAVRCREDWQEWLRRHDARARALARQEFEDSVLDQVGRYSRSHPDADLDYILSVLDVHMLFSMGADRVWPGSGFESRLSAALEQARRRWLPIFRQALADGGYRDVDGSIYWQVWFEDFVEEEIPWLPASFWWRHLPGLLREEMR